MSVQERVQVGIYSLAEGAGRVLLNLVILGLAFGLAAGAYVTTQFRGLRDADAMDQAQVGRAVAEGRGFTTRCLRPLDLSLLAEGGVPVDAAVGVADIRHAPFYPALLGAAFRVLPTDFSRATVRRFAPERGVVIPVGLVLVLLSAGVMTAVAWRVFGAPVALTSLILLLFSRGVLDAVLAGGSRLAEMLAVTLVFGLALAAGHVRGARGPGWRWGLLAAGAGVAGGLAMLAGYALLVATLAGAVLLGSGFVRWRGTVVALYVLLAALVIGPWLARNHQVSGRLLGVAPYAALDGTYLHEAGSLARAPLAPPTGRETLLAVRLKLMENLAAAEQPWTGLGEGFVMAFFLVALFVRFEQDGANALKWCLMAAMAARLLLAAAGTPAPDVLLPFLPWVLVLAAAFLFQMLDRAATLLPELRRLLVVGWMGASLLPTLLVLLGASPRQAYPPYAPAFTRYVSGLMEPSEVLASDIPWAVAWHGNRTALLIPETPAQLVAMSRDGLPVGGVYLTTRTADQPYVSGLLQGADRAWLPLLNHLVPEDFPWRHGFAVPPGQRDQLFLTDRPRWPLAPTPPAASVSDGGSASGG